MNLPGRKFNAGTDYRYGFNGKENDKDAGEGIQDYGMRIYDARLGKFLSVDPLTRGFPMITPYQFAENQPIWAIDLDGLEKYIVTNYYNEFNQKVRTTIEAIGDIKNKKAVDLKTRNVHGQRATYLEVYTVNRYADGTTRDDPASKALDKKLQDIYDKKAKRVKSDATIPESERSETDPESKVDRIDQFEKGTFKSRTLNGDLYDHYIAEIDYTVSKPFEETLESDYTTRLFGGVDAPIEKSGATVLKDVNVDIGNFKKLNPEAKVIKTSVTITGKQIAKDRMTQIKNELEKNGIKVKIKIDNKYKSPRKNNSDQNFHITTVIKGA